MVISNCVINLSGDKSKAIKEAARVLRPGGRLAVSDVIADPDLDARTRADLSAWTGCIAGALTEADFRAALHDEGFTEIEIRQTHRVHEHAGAAIIRARKPGAARGIVANCSLDNDGLTEQLDRYRLLGQHVSGLERHRGMMLVQFSDDPPADLLDRTVETERRCCPSFVLEYDAATRRLAISVADPEREGELEALARAFGPPGGSAPRTAS